jgi:hypothetical protein
VKALAAALLLFATIAFAQPEIAPPVPLELPGGVSGIGFDDLWFATALHRVLVPAGRTGRLDLVDPSTRAVESIGGFSADETFGGGHGQGTTSADAGAGAIFAGDRGRSEVVVIDSASRQIMSTTKLGARPDYVRWVEPLHEVWVTEPRVKRIERFAFAERRLTLAGAIEVPGGPESLVLDPTRGRAYTHTWTDATVVIDLAKRAEIARWRNGCQRARGIALDEARGLMFVGCAEGRATVLDVAHDGRLLDTALAGAGVDIVAYSAQLAHLYVPGGESATLTIFGVSAVGKLERLGSVAVAADSHCVTADDAGHAYVCNPHHGALLVVADPFPPSR